MPKIDPQDPIRAKFDDLCELEPKLRTLYDDVAAVKDDPSRPSFCAPQEWKKGGFKARLKQLVGHDAGFPAPVPDNLGIGQHLEANESNTAMREPLSNLERLKMEKETDSPIPGFPEALTTEDAYDTAYAVIYDALPDCRNCPCID